MIVADSYRAISDIARDFWMQERLRACTTQQAHLGSVSIADPIVWVEENRYVWAASPGWGEKWDYAVATHPDQPEYAPGKDGVVITDDDILSTVQALGGVTP